MTDSKITELNFEKKLLVFGRTNFCEELYLKISKELNLTNFCIRLKKVFRRLN